MSCISSRGLLYMLTCTVLVLCGGGHLVQSTVTLILTCDEDQIGHKTIEVPTVHSVVSTNCCEIGFVM